MANTSRHNDTPIDSVPEVAAYQAAKAKYESFREANPEFFQYLDALQEELNDALDAADKAVRAKGVSCGDFALYQYHVKYDPKELLHSMGRDRFLQVGGKMTTETVYTVDKAMVDASITRGDIPPDVAERVRKRQPRYRRVDKLSVL